MAVSLSSSLVEVLDAFTMGMRDFDRGHSDGSDLPGLERELEALARREGVSLSEVWRAYRGE